MANDKLNYFVHCFGLITRGKNKSCKHKSCNSKLSLGHVDTKIAQLFTEQRDPIQGYGGDVPIPLQP